MNCLQQKPLQVPALFRVVAVLLVLAAGAGLFTCSVSGQRIDAETWRDVGELDQQIDESSGLAPSRVFPGRFWTHNDNGGSASLFLIDDQGAVLAKVKLKDVPFVDWEAMSSFEIDGRNYLLLADVGDNLHRRETVKLYLFEEPSFKLKKKKKKQAAIRPLVVTEFAYADGARDCEAVAVDADGRHVWLISKINPARFESSDPAIYRMPLRLTSEEPVGRAEKMGRYSDSMVTGMSFSPDNRLALVRTYWSIRLFVRGAGEDWQTVLAGKSDQQIDSPIQRQGESISFDLQAKRVWLTSEGPGTPLWKCDMEQ